MGAGAGTKNGLLGGADPPLLPRSPTAEEAEAPEGWHSAAQRSLGAGDVVLGGRAESSEEPPVGDAAFSGSHGVAVLPLQGTFEEDAGAPGRILSGWGSAPDPAPWLRGSESTWWQGLGDDGEVGNEVGVGVDVEGGPMEYGDVPCAGAPSPRSTRSHPGGLTRPTSPPPPPPPENTRLRPRARPGRQGGLDADCSGGEGHPVAVSPGPVDGRRRQGVGLVLDHRLVTDGTPDARVETCPEGPSVQGAWPTKTSSSTGDEGFRVRDRCLPAPWAHGGAADPDREDAGSAPAPALRQLRRGAGAQHVVAQTRAVSADWAGSKGGATWDAVERSLGRGRGGGFGQTMVMVERREWESMKRGHGTLRRQAELAEER